MQVDERKLKSRIPVARCIPLDVELNAVATAQNHAISH